MVPWCPPTEISRELWVACQLHRSRFHATPRTSRPADFHLELLQRVRLTRRPAASSSTPCATSAIVYAGGSAARRFAETATRAMPSTRAHAPDALSALQVRDGAEARYSSSTSCQQSQVRAMASNAASRTRPPSTAHGPDHFFETAMTRPLRSSPSHAGASHDSRRPDQHRFTTRRRRAARGDMRAAIRAPDGLASAPRCREPAPTPEGPPPSHTVAAIAPGPLQPARRRAAADYLHRCRAAYGSRLRAAPQAVLEAVPWAAATQHTPSKTRRLLACDPLVPVLAEVEREVEREWTRRAAWLAED